MDKIRIYILAFYIILIPFDNFRIFPFSLSTIVGLGYIVLSLSLKVRFRLEWVMEMVPFLLSFVVFTLASLLYFGDTSVGRGEDSLFNAVVLYAIMILVTIITCAQPLNTQYFKTVLSMIMCSALIASLTGYYELISVLFFNKFPFGTKFIQAFKMFEIYVLRIRGTYFDPNYFSLLPLLVIMCCNYLCAGRKWILVLMNMLMVVLILATFSRMGILCLIIYYMLHFISKRLFYLYLLPATIVLIPAALYEISQIYESLLDFNPNSIDERYQIVLGSIKMIFENPLVGYGFNTKSPFHMLESHNTYLQILMYGGIVGFLLVFIPIISCYLNMQAVQTSNLEDTRIKVLLLSMFFPFMISIFFLSYLTIKFFWIFVMVFFLGKNVLVAKNEKKDYSNDK